MDRHVIDRSAVPSKGRLIEVGKKYKGQPFEVLLADPQYASWLLTSMHELIKHGHPALFSFLVTRFGQPERTPDHNRMQNRFLDAEFARKFATQASYEVRNALISLKELSLERMWQHYVESKMKEALSWALTAPASQRNSILNSTSARLESEAARLEWSYVGGALSKTGTWSNPLSIGALEFEDQGADVSYVMECFLYLKVRSADFSNTDREIGRFSASESFRVEVKPVVGDDYPAILRAMKAVKSKQLLVGDYCGHGASWSEVVKVFALSGITAVLLDDVEGSEDLAGLSVNIGTLSSQRAAEIANQSFDASVRKLNELTGP